MKYLTRFSLLGLLIFVASCSQKSIQVPVEKIEQHVQPTVRVDPVKKSHQETDPDQDELHKKKKLPTAKPSTVTIDKEGRLIVNGEPFFVIGLYSVPERGLAQAKELGFNSVHSYLGEGRKEVFRKSGRKVEMQRYLSAVHQHGLMAWVGLPRYEIANDFTPVIERYINAVKNSPALLAWYIYDEPDCEGVPTDKIEYVANMLSLQDPSHPKLLVLCNDNILSKQYYHIPDILITDYYPLKRQGSKLNGVTQRIKSVLKNDKPVWNVVQIHGKGSGGPGYGLTEPNFKELRNMVYQSIIAGAKSLLFFTYHGTQYHLYESPEGLRNIKKITTELNRIAPILLSDQVKNDRVKREKNNKLRSRLFRYQQKNYYFVVNLTRKPVVLKATIKKAHNNSLSIFSENRLIKLVNKRFIDKIEALGIRIYQF